MSYLVKSTDELGFRLERVCNMLVMCISEMCVPVYVFFVFFDTVLSISCQFYSGHKCLLKVKVYKMTLNTDYKKQVVTHL